MADRSLAGAEVDANVVEDVKSVVVFYDPATDAIVSVLPVPNGPPQTASGARPPPDLPALDNAPNPSQDSNPGRARGRDSAPGSSGTARDLNAAVEGATSGE